MGLSQNIELAQCQQSVYLTGRWYNFPVIFASREQRKGVIQIDVA